ncbi:general odorant-binding protein 84a [Sitodiplosis mosellana]|uniref:general odorant-binding protein 84a n=1 Tax=Sitodiplosis mosellana TaxID=263140 RepID=UPI002445120A|nr:general odorant-binding protein 84a [Sitodiplosis mosellana]
MSPTKLFIAMAVILFLGCMQCCSAAGAEKQVAAAASGEIPASAPAKAVNDNTDQLDQEAIMQMCNESFRTSMEYLDELNSTGAFPDETDKTPMCYIRCYLDAVGIIKDDELNREKANEMAWATSEDTLEECEKEVTDKTNPCEKAYFLTRCVMMRNIVDMRTSNQ